MSNVLSMEKQNAEEKLESFVNKNRKCLLGLLIALVVIAGAVCAVLAAADAAEKKGIAEIDLIEYNMVNKSDELSDEDVASRLDAANNALASLVEKKGIVGVRACMLASEVSSLKGDNESALKYSVAAAEKGPKFYTSSINLFNAAVYSEKCGKADDALAYYKKASESKDFYLASHALFSCGRVCEQSSKYEEAAEYYKKVVDGYANDSWANLAKTRLIQLSADGLIQ